MGLIARTFATCLTAAIVVAGTVSPASAQMVPPRGEGSVSVLYQTYTVDKHLLATGVGVDAGKVSSRGVMVDFTVGLGRNFGLSVAVPLVSAKYVGAFPHDTLTEEEWLLHPDFRYLDDGQFHSSWQDLRVELRYATHRNALHIVPFVKFILPTHNYEYLGHATVGRNVMEARVGVALHRTLPWSARSFVQSHVAYGFQEQVTGPYRGATHLALDGGYFVRPDLTVFGSAMVHVTHGGMDWNGSPRLEYSGMLFLNHDRVARERMFNLGVGASYSITDNYSVIGSVARTLWGINSHSQSFLLTVGFSRRFGRAAHDH